MAERPPTMTDLARRAGVSKNTVSLALRGSQRLPGGTVRRIQDLAASMGYQKNPTVAHLMAELRKSRSRARESTLAMLSANPENQSYTVNPINVAARGCLKRAAELGYSFDEFRLREKGMNGPRLNRILRARNIQGAIVIGMSEDQVPAGFLATWKQIHAVVVGLATHDPALSFACTDLHILTQRAFEKALSLGYRRPALALEWKLERKTGRFSAGFHISQRELPRERRLEPFYYINEEPGNEALFRAWFQRERPDAILTLHEIVEDWLRRMNLRIPRDVGLVQLEARNDGRHWAGMDQHNELVGAAAVEMVINMIHNHAPGIPEFPVATFIGSTWVPGRTVRPGPRQFKAAQVRR